MERKLFKPPPKSESPDLYLDMHSLNYWTSVNSKHVTHHDWLRYFLHLYADRALPNRHEIYSSAESLAATPINFRGDIGEMPLVSPIYHMMLEESGLLFGTSGSRDNIFRNIHLSFEQLFEGKNVFFLPGRSGQSANFVRTHGASIGLTSDERYLPAVLSVLNQNSLGGNYDEVKNTKRVSFLLESPIESVLSHLRGFRDDLPENIQSRNQDGRIIFINETKLTPDIIISTNMFNSKRYEGNVHDSNIQIEPSKLLYRILALGIPGVTTVYLIPSTEHGSVFTQNEISLLLQDYANVNFYDPEASGGNSVLNTLADLAVSIKLRTSIPGELL